MKKALNRADEECFLSGDVKSPAEGPSANRPPGRNIKCCEGKSSLASARTPGASPCSRRFYISGIEIDNNAGFGGIFLLLALFLLIGASPPVKHHAALAPGAVAPMFALPDVDGAVTHSAGYLGKTTVLNFCAFWCDTWKAEWPELSDLAAEEKTSDFRLVVVSVDGTRVPQYHRGVEQFQKSGIPPPPFPVLLDTDKRVSRLYGIAHVPTVVVIDASGKVRYVTEGYPGNTVVLHQVRVLQNEFGARRNERRAPDGNQ